MLTGEILGGEVERQPPHSPVEERSPKSMPGSPSSRWPPGNLGSAKGYLALPEDTAEKAKEWAETEAEKQRIMEGIAAFNRDPAGTLKAMK